MARRKKVDTTKTKTVNSAQQAEPVVELAATEAPVEKAKPTRQKCAAKKDAPTEKFVIQHQGKERDAAAIRELAISAYVSEGHQRGRIKDLELYVKPEEGKVYFVINGKFSGDATLEECG